MAKCVADFGLIFVILVMGGMFIRVLYLIVAELQKLNKSLSQKEDSHIASFLRKK